MGGGEVMSEKALEWLIMLGYFANCSVLYLMAGAGWGALFYMIMLFANIFNVMICLFNVEGFSKKQTVQKTLALLGIFFTLTFPWLPLFILQIFDPRFLAFWFLITPACAVISRFASVEIAS
jgi:hypothetical protein